MWPDIVEHHLDRARAYECLSELLGTPPTNEALRRMRDEVESRVEGCARLRALAELRGMLEETDADTLLSEHDQLIPGGPHAPGLLCRATDDASRRAAFQMAGVESNPRTEDELRVLSLLALGTARAMDCGDLARAVEHVEVQVRFLRGHGRLCVARLARRLVESSTDGYARIGRALGWQLEDDWASLHMTEC